MTENIVAYSIRVLLVFIFAYFGTRTLTKKAVAQMTSYELAGVILLSTVAAEPLVTKVLTKAIFGTGFLIFLTYLISRLALVNKLTPILEHTPSIVIRNGHIDMNSLKQTDLTLNEMLGMMRQKGFDKVSDVEFAILEPQGNLSVFPRSQNRPLQPKDVNVSTKYEGLTFPLIMNGRIIDENLKHIGLSKEWLMGALEYQQIKDYEKEVALAELDTSGNLLISKKIG